MHHHRRHAFSVLTTACLLAAPAWGQSAAALATPVAAPISDVVLYPGGATVFRAIKVAPGSAVLTVARLPAGFDTRTLRVEASAGIRVGETTVKDATGTQAFSSQEAELEAKVQALQDQQAGLDAEIKAAEVVKDYLGRLGGASTVSGVQLAPDAKAITAQAEAIGRAAGEALAKMQRLEVLKRELQKKVVALQADLGRLRVGDKSMREVAISVTADKPGTLKLSYQISNAGWRPAYRAELASGSGKVALERLAVISQKTGEDWSNVRLVLSTVQPRNSPSGPEPQPWLLSYTPNEPLAYAKALAVMAPPAPAAMAVMGRRAEAEESRDAKPYLPPTFETQSSFATEFEVPTRTSLASDGREISLQLNSYQLPVREFVRATPRLSPYAFVVAEGERPAGAWPAGTVQLFRDGGFIGSSVWNLADKQRFTLHFGRDDLVRVSSNPVKQDNGTVGVFDKKNERRLDYVYTIASAHTGAVNLQVLESAPVTTSDQIKVRTAFQPQPTAETWNEQRGVVAWEKTMQPNETAKFSVDYVLEFPKEGTVAGLR